MVEVEELLLGFANLLLYKKEYDNAILCSENCLALAQESGNRVAEMTAFMTIGKAHFEREEYDDAILYIKKCLANAQESGDKVAKIDAYMTLGNAYLKKEEYDDAISCSKKYLSIAQESGSKADEMNAYMMIGKAHSERDEHDDAIFHILKFLHLAQESGNKGAEMIAYNALGRAHLEKEEYDDAIAYSKKHLSIAQESGSKVDEMTAYMTIGKAHSERDEHDDAIFYILKFLHLAEESGDKGAEMFAYKALGVANLKKEEYDDALVYSKRYLSIAQESGSKADEMTAYMTIGEANLWKDKFEEAILHSEKCLAIAQELGDKVAEMNAYMTIGKSHFERDEHDDAISYDKRILPIAQEYDDKVTEMIAYMRLGGSHLNKEEYDDAILYSEKCLAIAQDSGNKITEMTVYKSLGEAHLSKEEYNDAILYGEKCLAIAQEYGNKMAKMAAYRTLGEAHLSKEEYNNAILYGEKCLAIAHESGNKMVEMNGYMTLGVAHLKKEEYDDAISYSKKVLPIAQASGDKLIEMNAYKALGKAHLKKKEYDDAIIYSEKCLAIAQESGDKITEMDAYEMLREAHLEKEEYDDAISYSKKYLSIAQESGNQGAEMIAYMKLVTVHMSKEEYNDVILYGKKVTLMAQEFGDKEAEMIAYTALGQAHLGKEEYDDAYFYFTEGLKIARDLEDNWRINVFGMHLYSIYHVVGIFKEYDELSKLTLNQAIKGAHQQSLLHPCMGLYMRYKHHKAQNEYVQAISCLQEAVDATAPAHGNGSANYLFFKWCFMSELSEIYVFLGDYDKSMLYQQQALDVACKGGKKSEQAMSHSKLGKVYYELKHIEKAEKSFKTSLNCLESIFHGLKQNDRFKIAFIDQYKETYKMLLKVLFETNRNEEALVVSDYYRAKSLKDLLVSSYGLKKEPIAKESLQYADVQSLVSSSNFTLLFYSTCFEKLLTFLVEAGNDLEFSAQQFKCCAACLDELVDKTFDEMKVRQVVNYKDTSLDVMNNSKENDNPMEDLDNLTQLLTRQREKRLSEQCRSTCGSRGNPSENSDESSLTSGLEILYHKLIQNINCLIKQDEIVIIPEGPLCKVPFAALRNPETGKYLSETKRIRMAPSIASLKLLQEYPEEHHSSKDALIIGVSVAGEFMLDGVKTEFPLIDGAIEEADEIALLLGVQPLLAGMATKPVVIKRLQEGASVVHIAAHGNLEKATIVLAPSTEIRKTKIPDEEDYMLTMADVQQAQVRAQLVVLSCCHSGLGEIKAEGVVGMCRAFLASGARAVVGSLWAVDDEATWKFMETFYKHLKDGKSASTSLHLTVNEVRRTPEYSEPKYWAPFFLMGDDVTIKFED